MILKMIQLENNLSKLFSSDGSVINKTLGHVGLLYFKRNLNIGILI